MAGANLARGSRSRRDQLGLGSVWPAERYDFKNVEVLCGAAAACTKNIKIATGLMNYPTHHPIELCSFGATMSHLSGGRFAMGFARGFDGLYHIYRTQKANLQDLAEVAELLRSLWAGGSFSGENRLGKCPLLRMNEAPRESPPLILGALGPKTLELAGRHYDGVLLHPFLTNRATDGLHHRYAWWEAASSLRRIGRQTKTNPARANIQV